MITTPDKALWQGRVDPADGTKGLRWHQQVACINPLEMPENLSQTPVILGFASDEGVKRNQGRPGAKAGPAAIRRALANLACSFDFNFYDAGDVVCVDTDLEQAQTELAEQIHRVLSAGGKPYILGGGHEVGWPSFWGAQRFIGSTGEDKTLGIVNLDAHFDLRRLSPAASSGTPFRQCNEYCQQAELPFHYLVLGLNPSSNTQALFEYAEAQEVKWITDTALQEWHWDKIGAVLEGFIRRLDCLYLTICLDVFSAGYAPGVSAPAALGLPPVLGIRLIHSIKQICEQHKVELLLGDIAELNPAYDRDAITAKLAARLLYEIVN